MGRVFITTSWDDGHPDDLKLAELLMKYQINATFYIPKRNSEGLPTVKENDIRSIAEHFEIGGHTIDHVRLAHLEKQEMTHQIEASKKWLEDVLGKSVEGFCYPGGKFNSRVEKNMEKSGYTYARTIENFRMDFDFSRYRMPTTLQFYFHPGNILIRNALGAKLFYKKLPVALELARKSSLNNRFAYLVDDVIAQMQEDVYLHIWGHSWEISQNNLWNQLEQTFKLLQGFCDYGALFLTNKECSELALTT